MKILHTVEFYHPSVGGMQEVVKQLSERMAASGHDVTVATTKLADRTERVVKGVKVVEFPISGNLVRGMRGDVDSYRKFLLDSDFDVITNFAAQQWATDVMITMLYRIRARTVFVPTGFSALYDRSYRAYFESMRQWMKQYDMNVFLSDHYRDIAFAREHNVTKRMVIPNAASEDEFLHETTNDIRGRLGIPKDHFLILHVGSHTGLKGHREAFRIFSKAAIRKATLLIVANDFGHGCGRECAVREILFKAMPQHWLSKKRVIVTALKRQDTVAAYKSADLFLFPSNVECSPLVLFESMASRTPFLTTDAGNAAEIVEWSQGGRVLPTEQKDGFSRAIVGGSIRMLEELYRSSETRKRMQESGYKAWQERFTWQKVAEQYLQLYADLVKTPKEQG